jgi:hypothetical protein
MPVIIRKKMAETLAALALVAVCLASIGSVFPMRYYTKTCSFLLLTIMS